MGGIFFIKTHLRSLKVKSLIVTTPMVPDAHIQQQPLLSWKKETPQKSLSERHLILQKKQLNMADMVL